MINKIKPYLHRSPPRARYLFILYFELAGCLVNLTHVHLNKTTFACYNFVMLVTREFGRRDCQRKTW